MSVAVLVAAIVSAVGVVLASMWFAWLRPLVRRSNEWAANLGEELALTGERLLREPESALYRGGTKPHSAVKGNVKLALTNRRLIFRKLTGGLDEVSLAVVTGTRRAAWFRGARHHGRLHLVLETNEPGEIGFLVRDMESWELAINRAIAG